MSKYDNTNLAKVASREPDGAWACCLCNGWKNRACDDKDFRYTEGRLLAHLKEYHNIKTRTLRQSNWRFGII